MSEEIFYVIIAFISFGYLVERLLDYLNLKAWKDVLPSVLTSFYDQDTYLKARKYHFQQDKLSFVTETFSFLILLTVIISGLFGILNNWISAITDNNILQALIFFGIIFFVSDILSMPFSLYDTFVLEEKYGFNRTTLKTYFIDKIKAYLLMIIIGGGLISLLIWFISVTGSLFWIYTFIAFTLFSFLMNFFYGTLILPLFNKLTPLEDGDLRQAIYSYAESVNFPLTNIFVMDGSKRSSKSNAFFTGFGKKKKIVLFDTLIEKHSVPELVAVLAHEIGHYKKKHVLIGLIISSSEMLLMLYVMSLFIFNKELSLALGSPKFALHINLIAFALLYQPLSMILGLFGNSLSRKHEFQADHFASSTSSGKDLGQALIKLSTDQLSNLTPHPYYVFFNYSHPPLLQRLNKIDQHQKN